MGTTMTQTTKTAGHYTAKQLAQVRRHLYRISRGLVAVAIEDRHDDGTCTVRVDCYEGRSEANEGDYDCRSQGYLGDPKVVLEALKPKNWPARSVRAGKLGCIEDPEDGLPYVQEVVALLN